MIRQAEILLVEDSPGDIRLTIEALNESKISNTLHIAMDGVEAMDFLNKTGEHAGKPTPDLILLDLNLPKKSGFEVLHELKQSKTLRVIPVVVLTTSSSERDIIHSYELHVNCFVSKPLEFDAFMNVIKSIESFWFTIVKLPK
ncbi:MAG: response regulator [Bacteroidia bacterium]|nr:response regulator [Bacteroidia bacterium]